MASPINPLEKIVMADEREDRKDSEEIPAWFAKYADSMEKTHKEILDRLGDLEKEEHEERAHEAADRKDMDEEDIDENTEGMKRDARKDESEEEAAHKAAEELDRMKKEEDRADESEEKKEEHLKEGGHKANEERWAKEREDKARKDAQVSRENRELKGKIAEMEAKLNGLFREPSHDDRNALAAARDRADAVYQAVTGKPASMPLPGESPIAYRKRMADGLRKFSATFKGERVDSLSGSTFDTIEERIYADAMAAAKAPENIRVGELRSFTRNDSGHTVTEYIGDPKAAFAPFSAGAVVRTKLTRPQTH